LAAKGKKGSKGKKSSSHYISPGVYIEEVPSGARPIEAVGTAVAAFVGFARRSPVRAAGVIALGALALTVLGRLLRGGR
jgi:phage tail sheath protein FI